MFDISGHELRTLHNGSALPGCIALSWTELNYLQEPTY